MHNDESVSFDLRPLFNLDPAVIADPHPWFDRQRADSPAQWFDEVERFVVTRHRDVVDIATNADVFKSLMPTGPVLAAK